MKAIRTPIMAIIAAAILVIPLCISTFQQQVFAQDVDARDYVLWRQTTHDFEKAVINAIGDPGISPGPRELLFAYVEDVNRIFPEGPDADQIRILLQSYGQDVATLLDFYFDGELQTHNLIKQFRQLTHAVATEVLTIAHEGFRDH
jgi:hypothetical protein